jgi:hypothetical protein
MNAARSVLAGLALTLLFNAPTGAADSPLKPRHAVFNLQPGAGATKADAALVADRYGALMQSRGLEVVTREQVNKALLAQGFRGESYGSFQKAAVAAAGILDAHYLIVGKVSRSGDLVTLETSLVDGRDGKTVRTATTGFRGTLEQAAGAAIEDNADELVGLPTAGVQTRVTEPGGPIEETVRKAQAVDWAAVERATKRAVADRLELGMRFNYFMLADSKKSSGFVGSITELREKRDFSLLDDQFPYLPPGWFARYKVDRYWGVEVLWNELRMTGENPAHEGRDGVFEFRGPLVCVIGRYPNRTAWTPYGGLGMAFYEGGFDHEGWWANGYVTPADYERLGPEPRRGKTRRMYVDDTVGYAICAGTDVKLWERLYADLIVRYVLAETDVSWSVYMGRHEMSRDGPQTLPFDHYAIGIGLKWEF